MRTVPFRKKVESHFKRHRRRYVAGGLCLLIGGVIGAYSFRNKKLVVTPIPVPLKITYPTNLEMATTPIFDGGTEHAIIKHIGRNGHPGNVIYCNETKQLFRSHREATRELGIDSRDLWAYLKGLKPSAKGYTFKRVGEAQNIS